MMLIKVLQLSVKALSTECESLTGMSLGESEKTRGVSTFEEFGCEVE